MLASACISCRCVCLSVRLSQVCVLLKWLNLPLSHIFPTIDLPASGVTPWTSRPDRFFWASPFFGFSFFIILFCSVPCRRLSWLLVSFWAHVNIVNCIISYRTQTTPHGSPGSVVFWCRKSRQNSNGVTPNKDAKCNWGRLKAAEAAGNWWLSMQSIVNLAWLQVYHTERTPARLPCCSASRGVCQRQLIPVWFHVVD